MVTDNLISTAKRNVTQKTGFFSLHAAKCWVRDKVPDFKRQRTDCLDRLSSLSGDGNGRVLRERGREIERK
jgi:hypothetical protein